MKSLQKAGGISAFIAAATYVFAMGLAASLLMPMLDSNLGFQEFMKFLVANQLLVFVWNFSMYFVNGICLTVLALALYERLKDDSPNLAKIATVFGLLWTSVRENRFELTNTKADVIFAFYGYNESFAGEAGLAKFKENVAGFIKHTLEQKYNGKSAPRLVLFSPIAHEFIDSPNLPSKEVVAASNARLKMYSQAMGEVAKANGVMFVDLVHADRMSGFRASEPSRDGGSANRTINGIHINATGMTTESQLDRT